MKYIIENIIEKYQKEEQVKFLFFWGHTLKEEITKACFSQWFLCEFEENGIIYKTAEHYRMAEKARLCNDNEILDEILNAETPNEAKSLGRKVKNFDPQLWDEHKYDIVKKGNFLNFHKIKN